MYTTNIPNISIQSAETLPSWRLMGSKEPAPCVCMHRMAPAPCACVCTHRMALAPGLLELWCAI